MIRHIVWWTLKKEACGHSAQENAQIVQKESSVLHGIPGVISLEVSIRILPTSTVPVQVILQSCHEDQAALDGYQIDPAHKKFAQLIASVSETRSCIDYVAQE